MAQNKAELVIIGAGYWGVATAQIAREQSREILLLDDGREDSASRNLPGLVRWSNFRETWQKQLIPPDWTRAEAQAGRDFMEANGLREVGESRCHFADMMKTRYTPGLNVLDDPVGWLEAAKAQPLTVERIIDNHPAGWIVETDSGEIAAKQVCLMAGVWTDNLLKASGFPILGIRADAFRAEVVKTAPPGPALPFSFVARADLMITGRLWPGMAPAKNVGTSVSVKERVLVRIGDVGPAGCPTERADELALARIANDYLYGHAHHAWMSGFAGWLDCFSVGVVAPGFVVAAGAGRVGLGVSGIIARKALSLL